MKYLIDEKLVKAVLSYIQNSVPVGIKTGDLMGLVEALTKLESEQTDVDVKQENK